MVQFHAYDQRMGDHFSKWLFDMEFALSPHTEALVLTHFTCNHRVLFQAFGYHDSIEEEEEQVKRDQASIDADPQKSPVSIRVKVTTTPEEARHDAAKACARRTCPGSVLHRLACTCFIEPFLDPVRSFRLSILSFIRLASLFVYLEDPVRDYMALFHMSPATLHLNGLAYEDLLLLLP